MLPILTTGDDYVNLSSDEFNKLDDFIPLDVCHYTTKATGKIILETGNLRFSRLIDTNDPIESKTRLYSDPEWKTDTGFWHKTGESLEDQLMAEWKLSCFSCHKNPIKHSFMNTDLRRLYAYNHGIFGIGYSSMWAHYGEKHKGICLLFNGRELDNNIKENLEYKDYVVKHGFVKYDDIKVFLPVNRTDMEFVDCDEEEKIRKSLIKNYKSNFLYKSTEWKSEYEFRWLVQSRDPSILDIPIKKAIRSIVLGADFPDIEVNPLRKLCFSLGIPVSKITWVGGKPEINFFNDSFSFNN